MLDAKNSIVKMYKRSINFSVKNFKFGIKVLQLYLFVLDVNSFKSLQLRQYERRFS